MPELSRNAQVLRYLLDQAPGLGHTKLLKYAYLADCEARRYLGRPISAFRYRRDNFGPFDQAFYAAKDELIEKGYITSTKRWVGPYVENFLEPTPTAVEYDFSPIEAEVLRYVAMTYLNMTVRELCDEVVYQTEPMKVAKMWDYLPMDKLNRDPEDKLGFRLERMLAGEESAEAGRVRSLAEVLSELRARDH